MPDQPVEQPMDRRAQTAVPIHPPIAGRWSPRGFDPQAQVSKEQVTALLEAARWAATWGRRQPVRFLVGLRGDDTYRTLVDLLSRGNAYAAAAGALILLCADQGDDENTALYSAVDAGAAEANLLIEAVSRGLVGHPMAGFDAEGAHRVFGMPDNVRPLMVIAVGTLADPVTVDSEVAERDAAPRSRRPLAEVAFQDIWDLPWQ